MRAMSMGMDLVMGGLLSGGPSGPLEEQILLEDGSGGFELEDGSGSIILEEEVPV